MRGEKGYFFLTKSPRKLAKNGTIAANVAAGASIIGVIGAVCMTVRSGSHHMQAASAAADSATEPSSAMFPNGFMLNTERSSLRHSKT